MHEGVGDLGPGARGRASGGVPVEFLGEGGVGRGGGGGLAS
ncbi:hypothetical protein [Streptomyces sp. SID5473]|nr:hypothetical protein [Streptomyces sp. SID5473]